MRKHIYKGIILLLLVGLLSGCQVADGEKDSMKNETENLRETE